MLMWSADQNPRSSEPKQVIPVESFELHFATSVSHDGRVSCVNFLDADQLVELWKSKYRLSPRTLFDFHQNDGGGLVLTINNLVILSDFDYSNFVIQFSGWKKILSDDSGGFDTGEPGDSIEFEVRSDSNIRLALYHNFRWGDNSWVFPDAKAFRVALMHAYAEVAIWVRAADPAYYEELLKNGTLPVPAPDS